MIAPLWQNQSFPEITKMVLAGDWNAFNKDDTALPWNLTRITAPDPQGTPDGFDWFINSMHIATAGWDTAPGVH